MKGQTMGVYKIPLKFEAGEFKFGELDDIKRGECLELDYDNEYQMITYDAPMYGSEVRVYTVPRALMPNALTAVYGKNGELDKVEFDDNGRTRLFYILYKDIGASERGVLKFIKEQADKIAKEVVGRKQTLSRLFVGRFYDGEAVEIAVRTATTEEMQEVIEYYNGDVSAADNSGNYSVEKMITVDHEALGVMLMCTNGDFRSMLFNKAAETFEERLKSRVLDKVKKTDDFKFISEEYD